MTTGARMLGHSRRGAALAAAFALASASAGAQSPWTAVDQALGRTGASSVGGSVMQVVAPAAAVIAVAVKHHDQLRRLVAGWQRIAPGGEPQRAGQAEASTMAR